MAWGDAFSAPATPRDEQEHWSPQLTLLWDARNVMRQGFLVDLALASEVVAVAGGHLGAARGDRGVRITVPGPGDHQLARIARGDRGWLVTDLSAGAVDVFVDGEPATRPQLLTDGARLEIGPAFFVFRHGYKREQPVTLEDFLAPPLPSLATFNAKLAAQYQHLERVAPGELAVLVTGETGTGKERVARAVHELAGRAGAFVAVNCGAIPAGMVEATFFGHRRGAFTGAVDGQLGLFRAADRGTLFLDELGELPLAAQAALLRVLQEGEVTPVGDTRPSKVDVRVVAATNQNLLQRVVQGLFRGDLLTRLNAHELRLPTLAARREDLGLIARSIAYERTETLTFTQNVARTLVGYPWPGNIRELEQVVRAALAIAPNGAVQSPHLPERLRLPTPMATGSVGTPPDLVPTIDLHDREVFLRLMIEHRGNATRAAAAARTHATTIHRLAKRHGVDLDSLR